MIENIYFWITFILGNITLLIIMLLVLKSIANRIIMFITRRSFLKALKNNQFIQKSFEPRTEEEKNSEGSAKKMTMNFKTMKVTETYIKEGDENNENSKE